MSTPVASPPLDEITTALLGLFRGAGRTVHDGAYSGSPTTPSYPYAVLYSVPGGSADPMPDLDLDLTVVTAAWQVTAVSNVRNQAQATARQFRDRLLARTLERADQLYTPTAGWLYPIGCPDGWQIVDRRPDPALAGVVRDGDPPVVTFSAPFRFTLTITPA